MPEDKIKCGFCCFVFTCAKKNVVISSPTSKQAFKIWLTGAQLGICEYSHTDLMPFTPTTLENETVQLLYSTVEFYYRASTSAQRCPQLFSWYHWTACTNYGSFQRGDTAMPNGMGLATLPDWVAALLIQQSELNKFHKGRVYWRVVLDCIRLYKCTPYKAVALSRLSFAQTNDFSIRHGCTLSLAQMSKWTWQTPAC